jgi:hypothetical protein
MKNIIPSGLSNFELIQIAKNLNINLNGVYMRDKLTKETLKPGLTIINIQSSQNGSGTHWTAFYYNKRANDILYFDPYGMPPVQDLVDIMPCDLYYSDRQIQDYSSTYCGLFCLAFLQAMSQKGSMVDNYNRFLSKFTLNKRQLKNNDILVIDLLNQN